MNFHDVNNLIEEGEGFTIEFKRRISSPEKIARTLISFANTRGGTILFGVDDERSASVAAEFYRTIHDAPFQRTTL